MPVSSKKVRMFCVLMAFHIVACVFLRFSFFSPPSPTSKILVPTSKFWRNDVLSKSFWNREQQRLDFLHNPNLNSSLSAISDWLNDMAPKSDPCEPDLRVQQQIQDFNLLPRLFQDFLLYSHCRTFPMLLNQPRICEDKPLLLLVVKTLVPHFERRQAIRETWGRVGTMDIRTVFLMGNALPEDNHPNLTELLRHEAQVHRDVLQWDFRDTFLNLTLKDVLFLDWFSSFCPDARFVLKGDDDVFVNTPRILDFLDHLSPAAAPDLFTGDVISNAGPHRDKRLKYFVPESYFVGSYPAYAGGGGVLYSGGLALRLREASRRVALYPIDDVYTGMVLQKLGLAPEGHSGFKTFDINSKYRDNPCIYRTLMVVHSRAPQEIERIWTWIMQKDLDCQ